MHKCLSALILCFFIAFGLTPLAATAKTAAKKKPAILKIDTLPLKVRTFNQQNIRNYLQDKDFNYNKSDVAGESLWDRFWHWFWSWFYHKIESSPGSEDFFYYLFVALGVAFLIFLTLKITGLNVVQIFRGEAKKLDVPYAESLENIHEINFDTEIEKAISQRNYRLAVRLLYLRSLKQLSDAHLIHWQIEKTNTAYLHELADAEQRQTFNLLTRQFEYIWYGDFFIDNQSFQNINTLFQDFKKMLR